MTPQTKLYLLIFLDSLCLGLLLPVLNTHILSLNGTHTITGLLGSITAFCQLISKQITPKLIENLGNEYTLVILLAVALFTNALLGLTGNYVYVLILRTIFTFTGQIETLCTNILTKDENEDENASTLTRINVLSILGMVLGPVIGGLLYVGNDFRLECCFLVAANLVSIELATNFTKDLELPTVLIPSLTVEEVIKAVVEYFRTIYNSHSVLISSYKPDLVSALRILVRISQIAFITKFSLLLKVNFDLPVDYIGYTVAYQNAIFFLLNLVIISCSRYLTSTNSNQLLILISTFPLCISMISIAYSSSFNMYLLYFVPLAGMLVYLSSLWNLVFASQTTQGLDKALQIVDVFFPVVYGMFCDWLGVGAFKFFAIGPLCFANILVGYHLNQKII